MKTLQVTNEWLNKFHEERIELITTIDNREIFTKTIKGDLEGNHLNYITVFRLIETLVDVFGFMKIDSIRLIWSEKLDDDGLQFFKNEDDFESWKENVLDGKYEFENSFVGDYEDSTDIYYNYSVDAEGIDESLYIYDQMDRAGIYIWYNPNTDTTHFSINIELRKALFFRNENTEWQLPDDCLKYNKALLAQIDDELELQLFLKD